MCYLPHVRCWFIESATGCVDDRYVAMISEKDSIRRNHNLSD
jgi:hypothetical protein